MRGVGQPGREPDRREPDGKAVFATADKETATKEYGGSQRISGNIITNEQCDRHRWKLRPCMRRVADSQLCYKVTVYVRGALSEL